MANAVSPVSMPTGTPLASPVYLVINDGSVVSTTNGVPVNIVAGTISAENPSVGTNNSTTPTSSTAIGGSDGTNLQQLLVESSSHPNLRVGLYNGGNELGFDNSTEARVSLYVKTSAAGDTVLTVGNTTMANSLPVTMASNQSNIATNTAQIGGQTPTLDNTTIQAVSMRGKGAGTAGDTALLLDALGQMTIEQFVQYQIMAGHGFTATTGVIATGTGSNNFICMQAASNAVNKHFLFFNIVAAPQNLTGEIRVYTAAVATADSNLSTALTAYNMQPKSATTTSLTTLAGSPASTTQTSGFTGNQSMTFASSADADVQLLTNGAFIYFGSGDTASVEVAIKIPTTANAAAITMNWVEW